MFTARAANDSSAPAPVNASAPPPGYHDIKTPSGAIVRVADQGGPHMHGPTADDEDEPYDPQNANFSRISSFAGKKFDAGRAALSEAARNGPVFSGFCGVFASHSTPKLAE